MTLSDKEIQQLLEKAESYEDLATAKGSDYIACLKKALECYNQIIENAPSHPHYFSERAEVKYMLAGKLSSSRGSYLESAIDDISKAIELEPDQGDHYRSRGLYYFSKLDDQEVVDEQLSKRITEDYHTCISKNPSQHLIWLHLLSLNLISRNYDEAISVYGQCKPYIDSKEDRLIRAWLGCIVFILVGDSVEEEDIKPLHNQEIRLNWVTLIQLTMSHLKRLLEKEKNKESRKKVNEINELLFSHIDDWFIRGNLLRAFGCFEGAIKAFDKAIEFNPNHASAHHNLGSAYGEKRMYDEAILAYKKAIAINPNYADAHNNLELAYRKKEACDEAILACKEIIALDPSYADMLNNRVLEHLKPHREGTKQDGGAGESMKQKPSSLGKSAGTGAFVGIIAGLASHYLAGDNMIFSIFIIACIWIILSRLKGWGKLIGLIVFTVVAALVVIVFQRIGL